MIYNIFLWTFDDKKKYLTIKISISWSTSFFQILKNINFPISIRNLELAEESKKLLIYLFIICTN